MKVVFVSFFLFLAVSVLTTDGKESSKGLTCEQEVALVQPCVDYLTKKTEAPSTSCCDGLKKIISSSPTKKEKQAACKCLKKAASEIPNLCKQRANNLCKECKIKVDNFIPNDLDCEKIV
ncbi:non-specific lipid-transfer protein A-like [Vigna umbellata]|uniref:non-specific lipid-transfer protein A-like n=1 Tax=Vigna umbellata TaxID=87088 RepID=UPI001F5F22AF|nr:non-specific lipid-transfer protein A-like [Vigna umbellata]